MLDLDATDDGGGVDCGSRRWSGTAGAGRRAPTWIGSRWLCRRLAGSKEHHVTSDDNEFSGERVPGDEVDRAELERYVRHLQRQVQTEGTEEWFSHERHKAWIATNRARVGESLPERDRAAAVESYVNYLEQFNAASPHDDATAAAIFQPLMKEVIDAAQQLGLRTRRAVVLACSPSIETTPFTLPSAGDHILLVGTATSAFCNYWAKIFVSLVHGQPVHRRAESGPIPSRMTLEAVSNAVKLALYYGYTGTVLGHGALWSDPQWFAPRMEYVTAMEMFVLSHEYGHCIAEEASDRYRGMLSAEMSRELELLCDRMGTAIAKLAGTNGGWVSYCGGGATLMIYASAICERARDLYGGARTSTACTHPPAQDRIAVIRAQVLSTTPPDQLAAVISFLDDLTALCEELKEVVVEILEDMAARHTTSPE